MEPDNMAAIRGSNIILKCLIKNRGGNVQWTRAGFGLGIQRELPNYPRYTMIGQTYSNPDPIGMYLVLFYEQMFS